MNGSTFPHALSHSFPKSFCIALLAALLSLPLLAAPAAAQFDGPGVQAQEVSVQSILDDPQENQPVKLRGRLLEQVDNEKYVFSDGDAQIHVEIDDEVLSRQEITPQMQVEIYGEVEDDFLQDPELDVERLTLVQDSSGQDTGQDAGQNGSPEQP